MSDSNSTAASEEAGAPTPINVENSECCVKCATRSSTVTETVTGQWGDNPPVTFTDTFYRCEHCGEEWFTPRLGDRHFSALTKATIASLRARVTEAETQLTTHVKAAIVLSEQANALQEAVTKYHAAWRAKDEADFPDEGEAPLEVRQRLGREKAHAFHDLLVLANVIPPIPSVEAHE